MIINDLRVPDEVYELYGSSQAMAERLIDTAGEPRGQKHITLGPSDIEALQEMFGTFDSAAELIKKVSQVGTFKVQGKEYKLNRDQIQRIKQEALFYEGRVDANDPAAVERAVQRYLAGQLEYYMNQMTSNL